MRRKRLTRYQLATLDFIKEFFKKNKYMPTYAEIGDGLGVSSKTAFDSVKRIEKKGYIQTDRRPRMLKIL